MRILLYDYAGRTKHMRQAFSCEAVADCVSVRAYECVLDRLRINNDKKAVIFGNKRLGKIIAFGCKKIRKVHGHVYIVKSNKCRTLMSEVSKVIINRCMANVNPVYRDNVDS